MWFYKVSLYSWYIKEKEWWLMITNLHDLTDNIFGSLLILWIFTCFIWKIKKTSFIMIEGCSIHRQHTVTPYEQNKTLNWKHRDAKGNKILMCLFKWLRCHLTISDECISDSWSTIYVLSISKHVTY